MPRQPRPAEVADTLERAAILLEQKGWCRGQYKDGDRHCALGAIEAVTRTYEGEAAAISALGAELALKYGPSDDNVAIWNDSQSDKRKVTRAMRRAARHIRDRKLVSRINGGKFANVRVFTPV